MSTVSALFTALVAAAEGGPGGPARGDEAWDGIGYLETTAREARVELTLRSPLDLSRLEPDDVVFAIAPSDALLSALAVFVEDGGAAVILLEANASEGALAEYGVAPEAEPRANRYHLDHPGFPVLEAPLPDEPGPRGSLDPHFVWYNVKEVILNHPVGLRPLSPPPPRTTVAPLIGFSGGLRSRSSDGTPRHDAPLLALSPEEAKASFVVEVAFGRGRALLVGDSSLAINDMQRHAYGDKQFVANLLRYFCGPEECRVLGVAPGGPVVGAYESRHGKRFFGLEGAVDKGLVALNDLATMANAALATPRTATTLRWLGLAAALLLAGVLAGRLAPRPLAPAAPQVEPAPPDSETWARALVAGGRSASFDRPARALEALLSDLPPSEERDAVLSVLSRDLGSRGPLDRVTFEVALSRAEPLLSRTAGAESPPSAVAAALPRTGDLPDVRPYATSANAPRHP